MVQRRSANVTDDDLRAVILSLLAERVPGKSICPSEAARRAYDGTDEGWRALMPAIRSAAARLAEDGLIDATQRGVMVDALTAKGPIRLRFRRA